MRYLFIVLLLMMTCGGKSVFAEVSGGVIGGFDASRTVMYSINNFTPYKMKLHKANQLMDKGIVFANGIASEIAPLGVSQLGQTGDASCVKMVMVYRNVDHEIWSPVYTVSLENAAQPISLTIHNDLQRRSFAMEEMEGLKTGRDLFAGLVRANRTIMREDDIKRCEVQLKGMDMALSRKNKKDKSEVSLEVLATAAAGGIRLNAEQNDRADMLVGGDNFGGYLVVQTLAVRVPKRMEYDKNGRASSDASYTDSRAEWPRLLSGGYTQIIVNIYTHDQYYAATAVCLAKMASGWEDEDKQLINAVLAGDEVSSYTSFYQKMAKLTPEDRVGGVIKALESLVSPLDREEIASALEGMAALNKSSENIFGTFGGGFFDQGLVQNGFPEDNGEIVKKAIELLNGDETTQGAIDGDFLQDAKWDDHFDMGW